MKNILIFDTETTGDDPKTSVCIEAAATLYSVEHHAPIASYASLFHADSNPMEFVNGISPMLLKAVPSTQDRWCNIERLAKEADAVVAHQASFDRGFSETTSLFGMKWICSMDDIRWPKARKKKESLTALALNHGVGVVHAHRAATDVDILVRLFMRVYELGEDVGRMLERAQRPKKRYEAMVSFNDKDSAKKAGFAWAPKPVGIWWADLFEDEACDFPFKIREVRPWQAT